MADAAPFLASYWPHLLTGVAGYAAILVIRRVLFPPPTGNDHDERISSGTRQLTDEERYAFPDSDHLNTGEAQEQGEDLEQDYRHVPYTVPRLGDREMLERSEQFYCDVNRRRSVRFISGDPVPRGVIENVIRAAGTSPSGAHTQPWTFVAVSNAEVKSEIRKIVEEEEKTNYLKRMGEKWVKDLEKIATNWRKPYLDKAPYIILVFKQTYGTRTDGTKQTHYYNEMSTCISVGIMITAIQNAGLVTVTTTPMNAGPNLRKLLNRPVNEKVILLLPVGFPEDGATVPDMARKPLSEIMVHVD